MPKELAVELTRQAGSLLSALLWTGLILTVVLLFRRQISALLDRPELSFEALGIKLAAKRAAVVDAAVQAAEDNVQPEPSLSLDEPALPKRGSVTSQALEVLLDPRKSLAISAKRVLWVDDKPQNNLNEVRALEELGVTVHQVRDTDTAVEHLQAGNYDLVITDLLRGGEPEAGLILMRAMRYVPNPPPVFVYSGARSEEATQAARAAGAAVVTSSPTTLFEAVVQRLANRA